MSQQGLVPRLEPRAPVGEKEMVLNLIEGVFLILHFDFSVGVGLCEQVMGAQLCLQLCPSKKTDHS